MDTIQPYFNLSFPLDKTKIRYKNRNPWITEELKSDNKIRDTLYKLKKKSPTPENIYTYKYTKTLIYQNKDKLKEIITMSNLKSLWKIIK